MRGHYSNSEHYPSSVITHKLLRETPGLKSLRLPCPWIHISYPSTPAQHNKPSNSPCCPDMLPRCQVCCSTLLP